MHRSFILAFFFLGSISVKAQFDQAIDQWKAYLPYNTGRFVTQSNTSVYYASDYSLLQINKEDQTVRRLSKANGLSDVGVEIVRYSPFSEVLIVAYANGNLDLIKPDRIINLPFIKQSNILGDRTIYNIHISSASRAFISTGFGILEINPENETFTNDIRTNVAVHSVVRYDGQVFAATEEGIYKATDAPNVNLQDFSSNWERLGTDEGFPQEYACSMFLVFNDQLFLNLDDTIFSYQNDQLNPFFYKDNHRPVFLSADNQHLLIGLNCLGCNDQISVFKADGNLVATLQGDCINTTLHAVEDQFGQIWLADLASDFRMFDKIIAGNCITDVYEGPSSGNVWDLDFKDGKLWLATGGYNNQSQYLFRSEGFLKLENNTWTTYNRNTRVEMKGENPDPNVRGDDLFDIVAVKASPDGTKLYAGSFIEGFLEYDLLEDKMYLFNQKNSSLGPAIGDESRTRVSGIATDREGNVWVTNYLAERPFSVYISEDRNWKSFSTSACGNFTLLTDIVVDGSGNKWIAVNDGGGGLIVFNEGDLNDPNDDQCRLITQSNSQLPTNDVLSIEVDLDGDVWVGTADGVVIFQCGSQVFNPEICQGFLQIVNVGGDNEYLLKGESVQAIAVDGANRKWFGTTNGIFVQSPSGEKLLASYNESNSSLFDNNITDMAINQETGEVFIGTARGLQSIRTDATQGLAIHRSSIKVFPNPVLPEYEGPIAIQGLARDANVKITDIQGQLVFETEAFGGQAIWDGKDYNGRKASSGVYLVFSTSSSTLNNPDAAAAKILFLK